MPKHSPEYDFLVNHLNSHTWISASTIINDLLDQVTPARAKRAFKKEYPFINSPDIDQFNAGALVLIAHAIQEAETDGKIQVRRGKFMHVSAVNQWWIRPLYVRSSYVESLLHDFRVNSRPVDIELNIDILSLSRFMTVACVDDKIHLTFNDNNSSFGFFKVLMSSTAAIELADQLQKNALSSSAILGDDLLDL
jgi:hypothetical protein